MADDRRDCRRRRSRSWRGASTRPCGRRCSAPRRARSRGSASTGRPRRRSPPPCAPVRAAPSTRSSSSRRHAPSARPSAATQAKGAVHFDRALAACRAIGHRLHESWIERDRAATAIARATARAVAVHAAADLDVTDTALLLSDVAAILGAGHSIDLLAHRMAGILQSTAMGARVEVQSESGRDYQPEPTAVCDADADGTFRIRLRGSDRRVSIARPRRRDHRRDLAAEERRRRRPGRRQPHRRHRDAKTKTRTCGRARPPARATRSSDRRG